MKTSQIILTSRPQGVPTLNNFRIEEVELPALSGKDVLLEGMYYSVDPYMRGKMNDVKSYTPPFKTGKPLSGGVIAKVLESKSDSFKNGDIVTGNLNWQKKILASENDITIIDTTIAPASYYLGILGMRLIPVHT